MRCKECKEKIPDNVKYCPECGALLNNKKYDISMYGNYAPPIQNNNSSPAAYDTQSSDTKNLPKLPRFQQKTKARIMLGVIFALLFGFLCFSAIDKIAELPNYEYIYENPYNINSVENAAYSYVDNILASKDFPDYDTFNCTTTIDWDIFFADLSDDESDGYFVAEAAYSNYVNTSEFLNFPDTEYSYTNTYIESTTKFEYNQIYTYMNLFNSMMNPLGLSSVHYVPYSDIKNMFETNVCIDFCDENNNIVKTEYISVAVVQTDSFYDVLYDDFFIGSFIEAQYDETASSEPDSHNSELI